MILNLFYFFSLSKSGNCLHIHGFAFSNLFYKHLQTLWTLLKILNTASSSFSVLFEALPLNWHSIANTQIKSLESWANPFRFCGRLSNHWWPALVQISEAIQTVIRSIFPVNVLIKQVVTIELPRIFSLTTFFSLPVSRFCFSQLLSSAHEHVAPWNKCPHPGHRPRGSDPIHRDNIINKFLVKWNKAPYFIKKTSLFGLSWGFQFFWCLLHDNWSDWQSKWSVAELGSQLGRRLRFTKQCDDLYRCRKRSRNGRHGRGTKAGNAETLSQRFVSEIGTGDGHDGIQWEGLHNASAVRE